MPFTNGTFANVAGATSAAAGDVIQSAVWNAIHADYSTALNMLMGQMLTTPTNRNVAWMNGGFEVWQKGAGSAASIGVNASSTTYTADRWYLATDANEASFVGAQAGLVDESQLCARIQRNSGQTGTGVMYFSCPLDTDEIYRCRGNIANLSFRVRAGANWSPASGTLNYRVYSGTGASPAKRGATPYTGDNTVISGSVNLTTSSALVQASSSAVVPTGATQMEIQFNWTPVGTAGTNDYFEIDDLQLELSLSPNTFTMTSYDRLPFSTMLEGCKRFYQKTFSYSVAPAAGSGVTATPITLVSQVAGALDGAFWVFSPELRVDPAVTKFNALTATSSFWISTSNSASYAANIATSNAKSIFVFGTAIGATAGNIYVIHADASAGI